MTVNFFSSIRNSLIEFLRQRKKKNKPEVLSCQAQPFLKPYFSISHWKNNKYIISHQELRSILFIVVWNSFLRVSWIWAHAISTTNNSYCSWRFKEVSVPCFLNTVCKLIQKRCFVLFQVHWAPSMSACWPTFLQRVGRVNVFLCLSICKWKQVLLSQITWKQNPKKHVFNLERVPYSSWLVKLSSLMG